MVAKLQFSSFSLSQLRLISLLQIPGRKDKRLQVESVNLQFAIHFDLKDGSRSLA